MPDQLDLFTLPEPERRKLALVARDAGMKTAVDHADAVIESWSDRAYNIAVKFLQAAPHGWQFRGETVREHAEALGLPMPPDRRAWGAVMMRLARAGITRKIGWTTAADPRVHCNPVSLWERA